MTRSGPRIVDVAGIRIALVGDHPVIDMVHREIPGRTAAEVDGTITVGDRPLPKPDEAVGLGSITAGDHCMQMDFERSGFTVETPWPPLDVPFRATVAIRDRPMPYGMPSPLFRWLEPTFHRPVEAQAYAFLHLVLESLAFLGTPVAPLHAAVLERDGRALALTSAGGVGKTTTAMQLLASGRWRYLSDDMTMLRPGRQVHPYARLPMVYEYNLAQHPTARTATRSSAGVGGRAQWALMRPVHGAKRRRRVPVEHLYGRPLMGSAADLGVVAFLVRHDGPGVQVKDLEPGELARRSTSIIALEFSHLFDQLRLAEAVSGLPLVQPVLERCRSIYGQVFSSGVRICEVRVPRGDTAAAVADAVEAVFDE